MYAMITGASSGLGKEFAILLAKKGYNLILIARREERLQELKKHLEKKYDITVHIFSSDISKEENCYHIIKQIECLPIHILINNAGIGLVGYESLLPLKDSLSMIKTNLIAPHIFTSWFLKQTTSGYLLNVSSIAAFTTPPLFATYGATKSYLYSLGTALNHEMKMQKKNISVTTLCPGSIRTEFYRDGGSQSDLFILSARKCAKIALNGMFRKKALIIPTVSMKISYIACKLLPRRFMLSIQYSLQKKKLQ